MTLVPVVRWKQGLIWNLVWRRTIEISFFFNLKDNYFLWWIHVKSNVRIYARSNKKGKFSEINRRQNILHCCSNKSLEATVENQAWSSVKSRSLEIMSVVPLTTLYLKLREKLIFLFFFISAILCLGLSSLFHTVCCHSEWVNNIFRNYTNTHTHIQTNTPTYI